MPIWENYRHYFDIDPDYFPAVNEAVINSKPDMWKKFFPHETFIKLLRNTVSVLDRKQKLSIWVEGAYGTGKSHAVLTEKNTPPFWSDSVFVMTNPVGCANAVNFLMRSIAY